MDQMSTWLSKKTLESILRIGLVTYFFNLYHVHFTLSIQHLVKDLSHCHLTWRVSSRIYTFFKLCNARREHNASLESVTKFSAAYAMKHICNQVAFNQVCLCQFSWTMGKYKGILSKRTKTFKQRIAPISRYKRIKAALESAYTEPYTTFCTFIS